MVVLVSSKSFQVLIKKRNKQKDPQNCYPSYIPVFTQMQEKKGLCYTWKVFHLAECSEIKGVNLSAGCSSDRPFLFTTGRVRCFHREMRGQMS